MKRLVLILVIISFASAAYAADYILKVSGGYILAPTIAAEIILDESTQAYTLNDYEGKSGYEWQMGVIVNYFEFNYNYQHYEAEKDEESEQGEIQFSTETISVLIYIGDPQENEGFNASLGVGKGVTHLLINTEKNGTKFVDNTVAYAKEVHGQIGLHYGFSDTWRISYNYIQSTMNTVTGSSFSNVVSAMSLDVLF